MPSTLPKDKDLRGTASLVYVCRLGVNPRLEEGVSSFFQIKSDSGYHKRSLVAAKRLHARAMNASAPLKPPAVG